jgi:adenylate cyclase
MTVPPERGTVHRDFRPTTKVLVGAEVVVSNVVGAAIVLGIAGYVLPTQTLVDDLEDALDRNLAAFGWYLAFAVVVGLVWGFAWVRVPRAPGVDAGEDAWHRHRLLARRAVLGAPVRITVIQAVPWLVAVLLFGAINVAFSLTVALTVGCVVALGGIATVAVGYRLSELVLRREVARVLAEDPPDRSRLLPGVAARSLGAWVLGTAVPLLGIALAAAAALLFDDFYTVRQLGWVVLVLAVVALGVGLLLTALTSTSIAAPVMDVRRAMRRVQEGEPRRRGGGPGGARRRHRGRRRGARRRGAVRRPRRLDGDGVRPSARGGRHSAQHVLRGGGRRRRDPLRVDQQVRRRRRARRLRGAE